MLEFNAIEEEPSIPDSPCKNKSQGSLELVEPITEMQKSKRIINQNKMKTVNELIDGVSPSFQNLEDGLAVPNSKRFVMKQKMLDGFDSAKKDIYRP